MHLAELLVRRPVPAAAIFLALTRRCPLHCAHCSTSSGRGSEQQPAAPLRRFVGSFSRADHPEFLLLTGGEPLLRPRLVRSLAELARSAGTRSYLLTGAYFASGGRTPGPVRAALEAVDHVAISVDVFHEAEVPRREVFRVLHDLLAAGVDASIQATGIQATGIQATGIQATGTRAGDPYLTALAAQVRLEFGDRVPMLATAVRPAGRARAWMAGPPVPAPGSRLPALPCDMAAWPVVGFDGTIAACCNPDVLDSRPVPPHLRLGHVSTATWPEVRHACVSSPALRALRTEGPLRLAEQFTGPAGPAGPTGLAGPAGLAGSAGLAGPDREPPDAGGYCRACRALADRPEVLRRVEAHAARPAVALIEQQAIALQLRAGPAGFARRHGEPALADLVLLGHRGEAAACARLRSPRPTASAPSRTAPSCSTSPTAARSAARTAR